MYLKSEQKNLIFCTSYTLNYEQLHVYFFIFSFNFLYTYVILQICKDIEVLQMYYYLVILMYIIKSLFV